MVWGKETYYNGGGGGSAGPTLNCCLPPRSITGNLKVKGSGDHTEGSGSWEGRARRGRGAHPERALRARPLARPHLSSSWSRLSSRRLERSAMDEERQKRPSWALALIFAWAMSSGGPRRPRAAVARAARRRHRGRR